MTALNRSVRFWATFRNGLNVPGNDLVAIASLSWFKVL